MCGSVRHLAFSWEYAGEQGYQLVQALLGTVLVFGSRFGTRVARADPSCYYGPTFVAWCETGLAGAIALLLIYCS